MTEVGGPRTTAVDSPSVRSNRGHEYNTSPALALHALYNALDKDERSTEIDVQCVIEFLERDVPYVWYAFSITSVRNQNVGSVTVLFVNLLEHGFNLISRADVDLVDRNAEPVLGVLGLQLCDKRVHCVQVGRVGQGEVDAVLGELACTGCADSEGEREPV